MAVAALAFQLSVFLELPWIAHDCCLIPQVMQDCPTDVGPGEGFKRCATFCAECVCRFEQTHDSDLSQIVGVESASLCVVPRDRSHELQVFSHPLIAWAFLTLHGFVHDPLSRQGLISSSRHRGLAVIGGTTD